MTSGEPASPAGPLRRMARERPGRFNTTASRSPSPSMSAKATSAGSPPNARNACSARPPGPPFNTAAPAAPTATASFCPSPSRSPTATDHVPNPTATSVRANPPVSFALSTVTKVLLWFATNTSIRPSPSRSAIRTLRGLVPVVTDVGAAQARAPCPRWMLAREE